MPWDEQAALTAWNNAADDEQRQRILDAVDAEQAVDEVRLAGADALRLAAAWYAGKGWPVFPLRPGLKTPATRGGFTDATTDPDQVTAWWRANPQANIGVPTGAGGAGLDVVDVDAPRGWRSLARHPALFDALERAEAGRSLTPSGGAHYWVPAVSGRTTGAGLLDGVDYRGDGGYVVVPPSRSADRRYTWARVPPTLAGA